MPKDAALAGALALSLAQERAARERATLDAYLDRALRLGRIALIIHGAAAGADSLAGEWAKRNGVPVEPYPADWRPGGVYDPGAGPKRNRRMLVEGKPDVVLAFGGNRGTSDMCTQSRKAGVQVIEVVKVGV